MSISAVQTTYGWYDNKRVVTKYDTVVNQNGSISVTSQRWFYPVHLYDSKAKTSDIYPVGKNIDLKI